MPQGDIVIIDTAGKSGVEEKVDGAEDTTDQEALDLVNDKAGDADPNRGTEAGEATEDAGPEKGEASAEEGSGDEVADPQVLIQSLTEKVAELEKRLSHPAPLAPKEESQAAAPKPITEEEWAKFEEERGIPRTAQQWTAQTIGKAVADMKAHVEQVLSQRFSKYDRQEAIEKIASDPAFSDAKKYSKEIDQYLQKVDPKFHSNPEVLKDAIIWGRGLNHNKNIQKVRTEKEINKRISGVARPSSPGGSKSSSKSAPALTAVEKSAADAVGISHAEYQAMKSLKGKPIAR